MTERPILRSVGGNGAGADPPSVLFQQLSADYPDLPRRVVGEVLSRVYGAAWQSAPETAHHPQFDDAARALLDAMRERAGDAARRTGLATGLHLARIDAGAAHPSSRFASTLRDALDPARNLRTRTSAERLTEALEARAGALGVPTGMNLLCEGAAEHLRVAAVAVSVPGELLSAQTVGVAGAVGRPLEELQVVLGEGPSQDGLRYGLAVLVQDLMASKQQTRWPLYAPVATGHGVRAQFVLPMQVGAAHFGVLSLYLERAGPLCSRDLGDAKVFAEVALGWIIDELAPGSSDAVPEPRERLPFLDDRTEIHQATGMVSVQLGVTLGTALLRIRARAFAEDRLLSDLAQAVVARTVRFQPGDDDRTGPELKERP